MQAETEFRAAVAKALKKKKMTLAELSSASGVSKSNVYRVLDEQRGQSPTFTVAQQIGDVLGLRIRTVAGAVKSTARSR